ncbi:unnamed protein product [Ilex paraguariensis]|uniref:WAT1-related protein n=1 Tax=Ilex paraguariensis TaxID=185542 RepID=A0ABC8ST46_9AQUA
MATEGCSIKGTYKRFKPHILMVLAQMGYTFMYFITEASFNHGMNPHVYITYRHIVAGLVMLPFAYFLERTKLTLSLLMEIFVLSLLGVGLTQNMYFASLRFTSQAFLASMVNTIASLTFVLAVILRTKLTLSLLMEIFVLSLLGVGLTQNMYFASLRFTSQAFLASMVNTIASLTFVLAVILRLEVLDIRSPRGIAKILGTLVSLAGVMTMTLYKGPNVKNIGHPLIHLRGNTAIHEN